MAAETLRELLTQLDLILAELDGDGDIEFMVDSTPTGVGIDVYVTDYLGQPYAAIDIEEDSSGYPTYEELVTRACNEDLDRAEKDELVGKLMDTGWQIAGLIDRLKGIEPDKGQPRRYGTRNRRSYTYRVRKALKYSYP